MFEKNYKIIGILLCTILITASTIVIADWMPGDGHKMHYPQLPDEAGWDVYATAGLTGYPQICLADDWECNETGIITDIHFWGSWKGGIEGNITAFLIAIHEDIPANQSGTGYSMPGITLWEKTFYDWIAIPIDPPSMEGWYNPYNETILYDDHDNYFQYNILNIQEPFNQLNGTIYWLCISAIVEENQTGYQPLWGWKSSIDHWNDDACWAEWGDLNWIDLWEPSPPVTNQFWIALDQMGNPDPTLTGGTDYYDDGTSLNGWYYYPSTDWWNIWFYDHPFDYNRIKKIFTSFFIEKYDLGQPSYVEVAINWATDLWLPDNPPPIPPDDEPFIAREVFLIGQDIEGFYEYFTTILEYNPEWVSIDVRGYNFIIESGIIEHSCLESLDLSFVITGEQSIQDLNPPTTRLIIDQPFYIEEDGAIWVTSNTSFFLLASDNDNAPISTNTIGINSTFYQIDSYPPQLYNGSFNFSIYPPDTPHTLRFWSIDDAGNPETLQEYNNIIIDDSPPQLNNGSVREGESGIYVYSVDYIDENLIPYLPGRENKLFREVIGDVIGSADDQHPRKVVDYEGNAHFVWMNKNDSDIWEIYYKQIDPDGIIINVSQPSKMTNKVLINDTRISDYNNSHSMYPSLTWEDHEEVFLNNSEYEDRYALLAAPVRSYIDQEQHAYNNKLQVVNISNPGVLWQEFIPTKSVAYDLSQDLLWWVDVVIYKNPSYNFSNPLNLSIHPQLPGPGGPNLSKIMFKQSINPWDILNNYSWLAFWGKGGFKNKPGDNLQPGSTYYIVVESDDPYEWCYKDTNVYPPGKSSLDIPFGYPCDFTFIERYDHPEIRFKHELSMMRSYLITQGYNDSDLYVLTIPYMIDSLRWRIPGGGYTDPSSQYWPWQSLTYNFSGESSWIDQDATHGNLGWALLQLQNNADDNDFVFINLINHGGGWNQSCSGFCNGNRPGGATDPRILNDEIHDKRDECFCTYDDPDEGWDNTNYWFDDEIDVELDKINYKHMAVVVDTCHAGGFIPDLIGPQRIILTCGREDETTYSYRYRFYERIDYSRSPNADMNGDNKTSIREAHFYAEQQMPKEPAWSSQEPQIDIWDNIHVVWADKRDIKSEIYYSKLQTVINCSALDNGVDLTKPDEIISDLNNSDSGRIIIDTVDGVNAEFIEHPDIAIDSNNDLHIIWSDNRTGSWQIFYQKQDNNTHPNVLINDLKISGNNTNISCCPSIYLDDQDNIHIAWQDNAQTNETWEILYQKQDRNGTILINSTLATSDDGYNSTIPDISVDTNHKVHITFMDDRSDDPGHDGEATHKAGYWEVFTLALNTDGSRLYEKRQSDMDNSSTWYGDYTGPPDGYSMYPQIAVSGSWNNGDTFLTWHDNRDGNWEIYYTEIANWCNNPSNDSRVTSYSKEDMFPTIALNRANDPDLKWQRNNSWDIYGSTWNVQMFIKLEIDGIIHHLLPAQFYGGGSKQIGTTYMYGTPLAPGTHNYSFSSSNGIFNTTTPLNLGPTINILKIIYLSEEWNLVSIPLNQSVNKNNITVNYLGLNYTWQQAVDNGTILGFIYGWNTISQNYGTTDIINPGQGYWIYAYEECDLWISGNASKDDDDYITDLIEEWNIVGLPYDTLVDKENLTILYNGTIYSWDNATTSNNEEGEPLILSFIYGWNETSQNYVTSDILEAKKSYWMYAYFDCILLRKL